MNLGFGSTPYGAGMGYATVPSYDQLLPQQPPKRSWQSRLYDRMMPQQEGQFAVGDDDKRKLVKQGLLQLGIGLLQHNNLAQGLGAGLQGGLLAMNAGAENIADRQFKQKYYAEQGVPSEFRAVDMMARAAGHQPGSEGYRQYMRVRGGVEGRASSAGFGFEEIKGMDGKPRLSRRNPRTGAVEIYDENTGQFLPFGEPGALSAPQVGPDGIPVVFDDPGVTQPVRDMATGQRPWTVNTPDIVGGGVAPPRPFANPAMATGRSPEEQAALTTAAQEQAKIDAQLRNAQAVAAAEANAAAQKAAAEAEAKTQAEVNAKAGQKTRDADTTLDLLNQAELLLPQATGSGAGSQRDKAYAYFGQSTQGAQATAGLKLIAAELTAKVPRFEGPQSDKDTQFYREAAGDLANDTLPVESRMAALRQMRALRAKYASNPGAADVKPSTSITKAKRQEKRRGRYQGRTVIEYTDGSVEYAD